MPAESQNTGYEGPLGQEKKLHKTHFSVHGKKLKSKKKGPNKWVHTGNGRYKLLPKKRIADEESEEDEIHNRH